MAQSNVPAVARAFAILDLLAKEPGLTFTEIHTRLNLPKSSTHHLVAALIDLGMLRQQDDGGFVLGLRLFEIASTATGQRRIDREAKPILSELAVGETLTCHLGVLEGHQAVYLARVESEQEIKINTWVGRRLSLNRSALGKVLLAWLPNADIAALMSHIDWERKTPKTIVDAASLIAELDQVRKRGWAFDDEEDAVNIRCIAAPVRDGQGKVIAAISAVGTVLQMVDSRVAPLAKKVMKAADRISEILCLRR
jgi:DNA-binding IclR family transcriptional regulator